MIALPHSLPFIRIGNSSLAVCQKEWLTKTLTDAADGTNLPAWLAEDISRGVEKFLEQNYSGSVIDSDELFDRIDTTLSRMGLKDVAANLKKTPPPVRISLSELARRAGNGYELAFFTLLEDQFRSAAFGGASRVECYGMNKCVRRLSASRKWSKRCEILQEEIMEFLEGERRIAENTMPSLQMQISQ